VIDGMKLAICFSQPIFNSAAGLSSKQGFQEKIMKRSALTAIDPVQHAREEFLSQGILPSGLVSEVIIRSWKRSADRSVGMERGESRCIPRYDLMERRDKNDTLLTRSQPVMENLYHEICGTSSMVLLADCEGVILHSIGDPDFVDQAQRVFLKPGGVWLESVNGTNAIGTALEEQQSVQVHSSEHFAEKNRFLTCSAAPIFDPKGGLLGVLDVSGDYRAHQKHTTALVRLSAQMIENQMFTPQFPSDIIICFHLRPEFIGTLYEGIAVFSPDGRFVAANRCALLQFGLDRTRMIGQTFTSIFGFSLAKMLEQSRHIPQPVLKLPLRSGAEVYGRVWPGTTISPVTFLPVSSRVKGGVKPAPSPAFGNGMPLADLELGDSVMRAVITKALKVAEHDISIMIEGESGTGKELFARGLHLAGTRRNGPFVALNCAAIPEGLFEAELFGYQEGAFTGAKRSGNIGKIREADNGTLFLDEIGEMPLNLQARLLRTLQERTVSPLGGTGSHLVTIAVICATNRRLRDAVAAGKFREDLYYRLNGLLLTLPSLRMRDDRAQLAEKICADLAGSGRPVRISPEVSRLFARHPWPGNIRQLHNVLKTALALLGDGEEITAEELSEDFLEQAGYRLTGGKWCEETSAESRSNELLADAETRCIASTLDRTGGNIAAAARIMGIGRSTLYRKLRGQMVD
jgi:transcriptional regulator of acetoin/glycerol metabolism